MSNHRTVAQIVLTISNLADSVVFCHYLLLNSWDLIYISPLHVDGNSRPGVIVICNSNDYNCLSNSNRWNRMQCNSDWNWNSNWAITLLLQLNISITPKLYFIENNQTKKILYFHITWLVNIPNLEPNYDSHWTLALLAGDIVTAAWLIGHLKPGPPAIYPFHTSLFIHSLKQDKGSRLPTLDMSLTSESINQSIITISQP